MKLIHIFIQYFFVACLFVAGHASAQSFLKCSIKTVFITDLKNGAGRSREIDCAALESAMVAYCRDELFSMRAIESEFRVVGGSYVAEYSFKKEGSSVKGEVLIDRHSGGYVNRYHEIFKAGTESLDSDGLFKKVGECIKVEGAPKL